MPASYGRGFRSCCDSPAQRGQSHMRGCRYELSERIPMGGLSYIPCTKVFLENEREIAKYDGASNDDLDYVDRGHLKYLMRRRDELTDGGHRGELVCL